MDVIKQIKDICRKTGNEWFLTHSFTQIALFDIEFEESLGNRGEETEWLKSFGYSSLDKLECVCHLDNIETCICCDIAIERSNSLDQLKISKQSDYDFEKHVYSKSKWIIADLIDGEIPGFMLIKYGDQCYENERFTHELVFACVRNKYRNQGILKKMVGCIPKEWNIWLEANSNKIKNVEQLWEKCGFTYLTTIESMGKHKLYKR